MISSQPIPLQRVLIVEDDPPGQWRLQALLRTGYHATTHAAVRSGRPGLH